MTRISFSILGAAGFAAIMSFSSGLSTQAQAAVLQQCRSGPYNTVVDCCQHIKRSSFIRLAYNEISCHEDVSCEVKKGAKKCWIRVTKRTPKDRPNDDGGKNPGGKGPNDSDTGATRDPNGGGTSPAAGKN
jgi:hypothetical protein